MNATADVKRESVLSKIRKMLDLAEGSDKQGEIDAALQQASNMMARYAIEQAEVDALKDAGAPEKIIERSVIAGSAHSPVSSSRGSLSVSVAENNRCRVYRKESDEYELCIVGYESDVDFVEMLWTSLCLQMDSAHDRAKHTKREWVHGRTFRKSFNQGFISEAQRRLKAIRQETAQMIEAESGTGTALVLIDRDNTVADYMKQFKLQRTSSGRSNHDYHAARAGSSAASRADYSGGRGAARIGSRAQIGA